MLGYIHGAITGSVIKELPGIVTLTQAKPVSFGVFTDRSSLTFARLSEPLCNEQSPIPCQVYCILRGQTFGDLNFAQASASTALNQKCFWFWFAKKKKKSFTWSNTKSVSA